MYICFCNEKHKQITAMNKKRIYFDMDGVLVDFQSGIDKLDEATKEQ